MSEPRRLLQRSNCASTQIGSLPHLDSGQALEYSFQHDIPFFPSLLALDSMERMIPSALNGFPGFRIDESGAARVDVGEMNRLNRTGLTQKSVTGNLGQTSERLHKFLTLLEIHESEFAKFQMAGPVTLEKSVTVLNADSHQETLRTIAAFREFAMARALHFVSMTLAYTKSRPLVFIDEPMLHSVVLDQDAIESLATSIRALRKSGALVGLHCCGEADWPKLLSLDLDVLSFDVALSFDSLLNSVNEFATYLEAGKSLALGLVATSSRVRDDHQGIISRLAPVLSAIHPSPVGLPALLVTPACGLGLLTISQANTVFRELHEVNALICDQMLKVNLRR